MCVVLQVLGEELSDTAEKMNLIKEIKQTKPRHPVLLLLQTPGAQPGRTCSSVFSSIKIIRVILYWVTSNDHRGLTLYRNYLL